MSTIHYNAEPQNAELLLRPILAANQHSIYGAVADFVPRISFTELNVILTRV